MDTNSSSLIDQLSNLNVFWILVIVAALTLVRYIVLKSDGVGMQTIAEYVESGIVAVVLVWMVIRPFAIQAYFIPSPSMEPTLLGENGSGDRILVNKFTYRVSTPKRDDVVVFIPPDSAVEGGSLDENGLPINFIKRLIGEPGDRIEAHAGVIFVSGEPYDHTDIRQKFADAGVFGPDATDTLDLQADHHVKFVPQGVLVDGTRIIGPSQIATLLTGNANATVRVVPGYITRNGQVLNEPFTAEDPDYDLKIYHGQPLKALEPYKQLSYRLNGIDIDKSTYDQDAVYPTGPIPPGDYFMMGDNRNDSEDSTEWGPLDSNRVVGRAQVIFWPPSRIGIIH